jgi:sugar phosphate isomerase/epimerase
MDIRLFHSLWGHEGSLTAALTSAENYGFDGLEGPVPANPPIRRELLQRLDDTGLDFIAEITTAGSYVPERQASVETHLSTFEMQAEAAAEMCPLFFTVIAGCDAWPVSQSVDLFGAMMELARRFEITLSFETHRSRSLFNPWVTCEILQQLPKMKLTCDFSHWCVVTERLVMDTEPEALALCARHAHHVHARVGYDQGPQVPHPAAPEYRAALDAHERWWSAIWDVHATQQHREFTTMTPEFGPDGYLHTLPYTKAPVADLDNINRWMAYRQREHFAKRKQSLDFTIA